MKCLCKINLALININLYEANLTLIETIANQLPGFYMNVT